MNNQTAKIGIFGGTFNPPHTGHVEAARLFAETIGLDVLYIIPAAVPPHKEISSGDSPAQRFCMTKIAFWDIPCKKYFSATELSRAGKSYSVDTVNEIIKTHGVDKIYMYVGSDMLFYFEKWKSFTELFEKCIIVTAARETLHKAEVTACCERYREKYGCEYEILDLCPVEISSTELRGFLSNKETVPCAKKYLTDPLYEYIMECNPYLSDNAESDITTAQTVEKIRKDLPGFLSEDRLSHTLSVEKCALGMAKIFLKLFGYSDEYLRDISAAALVHDITKCRDIESQKEYLSDFMPVNDEFAPTLHSFSGAYFALENYFVNPRVFRAVYNHTTGRADMDIFEEIIFLADYIEPQRTHKACVVLREKYLELLEDAGDNTEKLKKIPATLVKKSLEDTLSHLEKSERPVHPALFEALNFYSNVR